MAITIAVNKVSNNISISTDDVVISTAEVVQPITVNTAIPSVVFDASYLAVTPSGLVTATNVQGAIDQLAAVTEANDLTTSVTWADVPDANITESSVVQYITSANVSAAGAAMLTGADFTGDVTITNGELTVNGSAEAELFKGDIEGAVHFKGAEASGATLAKGDVVYVSGHSGQKTQVDLADASDSSKMPAFGIVAADPNGVNVDVVTFGTLKSINTSAYTDGDELFVSTTAGVLTATAPSGEGNLVQKIAKVVKAHNSGNIKVMGAGRTNATPNLDNGNIFIGDSNNLATTASFATQVASAETSHADVLVDGDFTSAGIMTTDGSGGYSVDSSTYATETYVGTAVSNLVDSAPATLDTLNELASALGDDANFSTTVTNSLAGKANLSGATFTGNVNIGTPPSGTQSLTVAGTTNLHGGVTGGLDVTGDITATGTVDGVDIATRDAVLTSTTTTANSAMQDLVDDTTPQLGGDLNLNSKVITGTGRLYINQASTSTPAVHLISGDTSDAASPTIRLERFSTTTADDDSIGKIEFYGYKESLPPIFPTVEYANITGVIEDATNTTIDGQIDFNVAKDDTLTTVMSVKSTEIELPNATGLDVGGLLTVGVNGINSTGGITTAGSLIYGNTLQSAGNTTVGGNVVVTGTVDGRDVATDGARLDTIPYHRVKHTQLRKDGQGYNLGTTYTNIGLYDTIVHPATPVECARYLDLDIAILWNYVSSNTNDLFLQLQMIVPLGGGTVTNMGTATRVNVNDPEYNSYSNYAWYYVSGDYTHLFTEFGRINTGTGTSEGVLAAWKYDSANDRTYLMTYDNPGVSFSTGDTFYYSPYAFENVGTTLTVTKEIDERYVSSGRQPHSFKFKTAYDDAALTYKLQMKEYTTSDSGQVHGTTVTFTDVEEL